MSVPTAQQIANALQPYNWPSDAVNTVISAVQAPHFDGSLSLSIAQTLVNQTGLQLASVMLGLSAVAALYAQPPISNFFVGAVVAGGSGSLYFGCNMEYSGQPLSFCSHGEQDATVNAWTHYETTITSLAVNAAPCGYCRQYLYETASAKSLQIILQGSTPTSQPQVMMLTDLLPLAFGPQDLGITTSLLTPQSNRLALPQPSHDLATLAGLYAANISYAPYTNSFSGLGLVTTDGAWFPGPLSENAAYNPSQSPLEAALALMNLSGYSYANIASVALVEVQDAKVSQLDVSRSVLSAVTDVPLNYVVAVPQTSAGAWAPPDYPAGARPQLGV